MGLRALHFIVDNEKDLKLWLSQPKLTYFLFAVIVINITVRDVISLVQFDELSICISRSIA